MRTDNQNNRADLDALDKLVAAATKGEIEAVQRFANRWDLQISAPGYVPITIGHSAVTVCEVGCVADGRAEANAKTWAALKNAYPALAAALRAALEKIRDRAKPLGLDLGDSVTMLIAESALALTPPDAVAAARKDTERLTWKEADEKKGDEGVGIYFKDGKFRYPYLIDAAPDYVGGVGEKAFDNLRAAIDAAMEVKCEK